MSNDEENKTGRPRIKIDAGKLEGMVMYGATCLDCAGIFNCSEDTIVRFIRRKYKMSFAEYSDKKKSTIRMKLRQKQLELALDEGNVSMLIWCGKQLLGQSDQTSVTQTSNVVQLRYALQGTPDELRKQIQKEQSEPDVETETKQSNGNSE